MQKSTIPSFKLKPLGKYSTLFICCMGLYNVPALAADPVPSPSQDKLLLNPLPTTYNQSQVGSTINIVCPRGTAGGNEAKFQDACSDIVVGRQEGTISDGQLQNVLGKVTSQQNASQNTQKLEMNRPQLSTLSNRISMLRSGRQGGGLKLSGLMLDSTGNLMSSTQLAHLNDSFNKAAAGDDTFSRLGVFMNGNIGFGDRRTTTNEAGYNLDDHGMTAGVDYRINNNFLLGVAFSYENARSGFLNNLGKMETDTYTGAIYGSFFTESGFFVDGIFSGGHSNFASTRNIHYELQANSRGGAQVVDTQAKGKTQGNEFDVAMTSGYNFNVGALTVTPQLRINYTTNQVDALTETEDNFGWGLHIASQSFESLQTIPGLQLAYSINLPWAVILPMVRADYVHEFENDSRLINAYFLGDPTKNNINILTDKPDRNYIVASAGVSAQFAHGISAFVNYDTVQAHSYVNNHNFSGGVRFELSF